MLTIVAWVVLAAGWTPPEWRALRGPGYEVQFPGNPSLKDLPFVLKAVPLKLKLYGDEPQPGRLSWSFGFADLPASLSSIPTQELLVSDRAYAAAIGGTLVKQTELSLDDKTSGTETIIDLKKGLRIVRRLYIHAGHLYQLTVIHPAELDVTETFKRFVASLKFSSPAPGQGELVPITEPSFAMGLPGYADRTVHDLTIGGEPVVMTQYQVPPDGAGQDWRIRVVTLPPGMRPQAKAQPKQLLADFRNGLAGQGTIGHEEQVQLKSWKRPHHGLLVQLEQSDGRRSLVGIYLVGQELLTLEMQAPKSTAVEQMRPVFDRVADSTKPGG